jgi:hypothetical protein
MINVSMDRAAYDLAKTQMRTLFLSAAIGAFGIAVAGFGIGWIMRDDAIRHIEEGLRAAFASGSQEAAQWLQRMELNPGGLKCQAVRMENGRRVCDTSLWMDPPLHLRGEVSEPYQSASRSEVGSGGARNHLDRWHCSGSQPSAGAQ